MGWPLVRLFNNNNKKKALTPTLKVCEQMKVEYQDDVFNFSTRLKNDLLC